MTDLLETAVTTARGLSPDLQDEIARVILRMATENSSIYELTAEELASLAESRAQSRRGDYATDEQVRAVWAKHGL